MLEAIKIERLGNLEACPVFLHFGPPKKDYNFALFVEQAWRQKYFARLKTGVKVYVNILRKNFFSCFVLSFSASALKFFLLVWFAGEKKLWQ